MTKYEFYVNLETSIKEILRRLEVVKDVQLINNKYEQLDKNDKHDELEKWSGLLWDAVKKAGLDK